MTIQSLTSLPPSFSPPLSPPSPKVNQQVEFPLSFLKEEFYAKFDTDVVDGILKLFFKKLQPIDPITAQDMKRFEFLCQYAQQEKNLKIEFYKKYDAEIVDDIFKSLSRKKQPDVLLNNKDIERLDFLCYYYQLEQEWFYLADDLQLKDAHRRIFNRYVKYARSEVLQYLNAKLSPQPKLSFENLDRGFESGLLFIETIPLLLERYDEWTCARALNHFAVLSKAALLGQEELPSLEVFYQKIDTIFLKEQMLRHIFEEATQEELLKDFDSYLNTISTLKDNHGARELKKELIIKSGNVKMLHSRLDPAHIAARATLFQVSAQGTRWALDQEDLTPLDQEINRNINHVYFLKGDDPSKEPVAVFKTSPDPLRTECGAMEALMYDISLLFGVDEALVPTKTKRLKDMDGSIQIFQKGMKLEELSTKPIEEYQHIISHITLKSFLKAAIASVLLGNQDLHQENCFIVRKGVDDYSVVIFDNEFCLKGSNYLLFNKEKESFLPIRCVLLTLPQADQPILGETKAWLQQLAKTWPDKFNQFLDKYLPSALGREKLEKLPYHRLLDEQISAFQERIQKLIDVILSEEPYTFRDLLYYTFPLYPIYYYLTAANHPRLAPNQIDADVGGISAEELCKRILEKIHKYKDY